VNGTSVPQGPTKVLSPHPPYPPIPRPHIYLVPYIGLVATSRETVG
jgi:hypothetical protein